MEILRQLGLDQTVWIQLGFFIVSYVFLSQFLFKPYQRNLQFRSKNTGGALDEAAQMSASNERLAMDYQGRMKKQNETAEQIYSQLKMEGAAEEDKLVAAAKESATKLLELARVQITNEVTAAKKQLEEQIPEMSEMIASRLLGRSV